MVNFQVVDAQNTRSKTKQPHHKEKLYFIPYPICKALQIYTQEKKLLIPIDEYLILMYLRFYLLTFNLKERQNENVYRI